MSSTNKTTNYELSQFIGSDKPAWLSDYNGDMGKIDAGIHTAQTTATGADGKATANTSAIGTLSSLTTEAKTNLVAAVNEVNSTAGTALNASSAAAGSASQAITKANDLAAYLAMTKFNDYTSAAYFVPQSGSVLDASVYVATNANGTYGKVYGRIVINPSTNGWQTIVLNSDTGIRTTANFTIAHAGVFNRGAGNYEIGTANLNVRADGKLEVYIYCPVANERYSICFPPCFYVFDDFGDQPES